MAQPGLKVPLPSGELGGEVSISDAVVAKLAGYVARMTYGVVDMRRSPIDTLMRIFRGSLSDGVEVEVREGQVAIGLHVIMERGLNLSEVTANLERQVRYHIKRVAGVSVREITVRVEDVRT